MKARKQTTRKPLTRHGKVHIGAWVEPEVYDFVSNQADKKERSMSFVIEKILSKGVTHRNRDGAK